MGSGRRPGSRASAFAVSEASAANFDEILGRLRNLEGRIAHGPGTSFALPLILVGVGGNWTLSESGGSLVVTGPSGTVTTLAAP